MGTCHVLVLPWTVAAGCRLRTCVQNLYHGTEHVFGSITQHVGERLVFQK